MVASFVGHAVALTLQPQHSSRSSSRYKLQIVTKYGTQTAGAKCLDGSDFGFYFAPALVDRSLNWQIMFEGGAWCTEEEECVARSHTWLGSSKFWNSTYSKHELEGIMSDDCGVNPDFCNFNRVLVPNCDGTSFTGNVHQPVEAKDADGTPRKLYFRGLQILDAVFHTLFTMGLQTAHTVMITGFSSGGLAALVHADYIHEKLKLNLPDLKKFRAVPLSGLFLEHTDLVGITKMYGEHLGNMVHLANSTSAMDRDCAAEFGPFSSYKCIYATNAFSHVKVPTFLVNPGIDEWQVVLQVKSVEDETAMFKCMRSDGFKDCDSEQLNRMRAFHLDIESQLRSLLHSSGNGAFLHSCPSHINAIDDVQWTSLKVRNLSMQQAVGDWWNTDLENVKVPSLMFSTFDCHLSETAPYVCNPTCQDQLPEVKPAPVFDKGCLSVCKKLQTGWEQKCNSQDFDYCHTCEQCSGL